MKCPNCRAGVDFGRKKCPRCGIVYQEVFESRAMAELRERRAQLAQARRRKASSAVYAWLGGTLGLAALAWTLALPPAGLPLPPQARENSRHGFAYAVPAGWAVDATELRREGLTSAVRLSDGIVSVEVLVGPRSLYDQARAPDGAARLARSQFNGEAVRLEAAAEAELDRLPARRLRVSGGRVYLPSPSAGRRASALHAPAPRLESLEFAGELIAVPGSGRSYLIKVSSDRDSLARGRRRLDGLLDSFRVTRRPMRWIRGI